MPKITQIQIGQVFLKETDSRRWRASWTDPATKRWIRRLLPVSTFKEAETEAKGINAILAQGKGFAGRVRGGAGGQTISNAIDQAVRHSSANEQTQRDYLRRADAFIDYLAENYAGIEGWAEVNEAILEDFIAHSRKQEVSHDTLRLRVFVLRLTSDFMARTFPDAYRDVAGRIRLKRIDPPNLEADEAILSPDQLRGLLAWLGENEPMVHVWAVLQGLCGVRLFEAAYLREQDFNATARTITITDTSAHRPKNRPSYRIIPIPEAAARTLDHWIDSLKVRHNEGYLFMPSRAISGRKAAKSAAARAGVFTVDRISHLWANALARLEAENAEKEKQNRESEITIKLPKDFIPRKLRASFVTALRSVGADFETLQRYIGHRPSSILSAHYDRIGIDRLKVIAGLADDLSTGSGAFGLCDSKAEKGR